MPSKDHTPRTRVLLLLNLLIDQPYGHTIAQLATRFGVSRDTIRGDMEAIQNAGFVTNMDSYFRYGIIEEKPFRKLQDLLHFTEEDQTLLERAIDHIEPHTRSARTLKKKLGSLYDFRKLGYSYLKKPYLKKVDKLLEAIEQRKQIVLENYHSTSGNMVSNRRIEPFHLSPPEDMLHGFDLDKNEIRHFRISRIAKIKFLQDGWQFEKRHKILTSDPFRIVNNEQIMVRIVMKVGGYNGLRELYPLTEKYIEQKGEGVYQLDCLVNKKFTNVGSFLLGFHEHILEIEPMELREWLCSQMERMNSIYKKDE